MFSPTFTYFWPQKLGPHYLVQNCLSFKVGTSKTLSPKSNSSKILQISIYFFERQKWSFRKNFQSFQCMRSNFSTTNAYQNFLIPKFAASNSNTSKVPDFSASSFLAPNYSDSKVPKYVIVFQFPNFSVSIFR